MVMGATLLAQLWPNGSLDSWRAGAVGGQVSLISHGRCFLDAEPPPSPSSSNSPLSPAETSSCLGCSGEGASPHVLLLCDPTPPTRKIHLALGSQPGLELKGDLTVSGGPQCSPQAPGQDCSKVGVGCFCRVPSQKGERPQVTQGSFRLDIRKNVFTGRVVSTRDKFPRELVESLSLEVIKRCLDVALGDRV